MILLYFLLDLEPGGRPRPLFNFGLSSSSDSYSNFAVFNLFLRLSLSSRLFYSNFSRASEGSFIFRSLFLVATLETEAIPLAAPDVMA